MNTPLRNEIDQELFRLWRHAVLGGYSNPEHPYVQKWLKQSNDQILNLVASKMPEKNHITKLSGNSRLDQQVSSEVVGWNEAIDSVKSILKGGTE